MIVLIVKSQNIDNVDYQSGTAVSFPDDTTIPLSDMVNSGLMSFDIPEMAIPINYVDNRPA